MSEFVAFTDKDQRLRRNRRRRAQVDAAVTVGWKRLSDMVGGNKTVLAQLARQYKSCRSGADFPLGDVVVARTLAAWREQHGIYQTVASATSDNIADQAGSANIA